MAAFVSTSGEGGEDSAEKMADFFGPGQVDQIVRQAIQTCWMALSKDRKTPDELKCAEQTQSESGEDGRRGCWQRNAVKKIVLRENPLAEANRMKLA